MAVAAASTSVGVCSWMNKKSSIGYKNRATMRASCSLRDEYRTLRIEPGASETEVKKAFRRLALQYHPDVCKESNCGVQFHQINQAYDLLITGLKKQQEEEDNKYEYVDEEELWEEWMGWEGAGIRDYTSHINPYI